MYCLKVKKIDRVSNEVEDKVISFDDFRKLCLEKEKYKSDESFIYKTFVYKVSNDNLRIEKLSDEKFYKRLSKSKIKEELKVELTTYSYIRKILDKNSVDYVLENSVVNKFGKILIFRNFKFGGFNFIGVEVEMVKSTPRYVISGILKGQDRVGLFEETSQNEIVNFLNSEFEFGLEK